MSTQNVNEPFGAAGGSVNPGLEPRVERTSDAVWGLVGEGLKAQIMSLPIASLRRNYALALMDWAETDTNVRKAARKVLTKFEVEGDSWGVPAIEDIVDALVARLGAGAANVAAGESESGAGSQNDSSSATRGGKL